MADLTAGVLVPSSGSSQMAHFDYCYEWRFRLASLLGELLAVVRGRYSKLVVVGVFVMGHGRRAFLSMRILSFEWCWWGRLVALDRLAAARKVFANRSS